MLGFGQVNRGQMMIFDKKRDETAVDEKGVGAPPPLPQPASRPAASVLAPDLTITGDLKSDGALQINGTVIGDVTCDNLVIGESGTVRGNIAAEFIRIAGTVEGHVEAKDIVVTRSAKMVGDVVHDSLTVEQGAYLDGRCCRRAATPKGNGATPTLSKPADQDGKILDSAALPG